MNKAENQKLNIKKEEMNSMKKMYIAYMNVPKMNNSKYIDFYVSVSCK